MPPAGVKVNKGLKELHIWVKFRLPRLNAINENVMNIV